MEHHRGNSNQSHGNIAGHMGGANITVRNARDQRKDTLRIQQQTIHRVVTQETFISVNETKIGLVII